MAQQELIVDYINAYNRFDIPGMLACLSPDVRFEHYERHALQLCVNGKHEFEQVARLSLSLFSSREQRILALQSLENEVRVELSFTAQLAQQPEAAPLKLQGSSEFRFKEGLISEIRDYC